MRYRFFVYYVFLGIVSSWVYAESHHPQDFLLSIKGTKNEGEQIYNHFCVNCHAPKPIIPLGAPRFGNKKDWDIRLKKGLTVLLKSVDEGLNAMPPRGGCFECSDEQLVLSIVTMIPKGSSKNLLNSHVDHKKNK